MYDIWFRLVPRSVVVLYPMVVVHDDRSIVSVSACVLKAPAAATRNATFRQVLIEEAYVPAAEVEVFHAFQFKPAGQLICVLVNAFRIVERR